MKEKIMNIKNILKIIISIFIIFSMIKSCSNAYTFDDFVEYCTQISNNEIATTNDIKELATSFLKISNKVKNNTNVNNYTNFIIVEKNYNRNYIFEMNNGCTFNDIGANYTNCRVDNITQPTWACYFNYYNTDISDIRTYSIINEIQTNVVESVGLVNAYNTHGRGLFNQYDPTPKLEFTHSTDYITVNIGNETKTNVIKTSKKSTIEDPIWRNYSKLQ